MSQLSKNDLGAISDTTIGHYDGSADAFWEGTRDHDVSQNLEAILGNIDGDGPHKILDFGCGPGRDLMAFKRRGHAPVGLDGSAEFVRMARTRSGCEVLHQDFLSLTLTPGRFDGIFANASLFHVPSQELPRVLGELLEALRDGGVLFASNPRGGDVEGWDGARYGSYHSWPRWRGLMLAAGYEELAHYYRPPGRPRAEQPWLASVWRKPPAGGPKTLPTAPVTGQG
jgi:SAM-dependent methyltransferase